MVMGCPGSVAVNEIQVKIVRILSILGMFSSAVIIHSAL